MGFEKCNIADLLFVILLGIITIFTMPVLSKHRAREFEKLTYRRFKIKDIKFSSSKNGYTAFITVEDSIFSISTRYENHQKLLNLSQKRYVSIKVYKNRIVDWK